MSVVWTSRRWCAAAFAIELMSRVRPIASAVRPSQTDQCRHGEISPPIEAALTRLSAIGGVADARLRSTIDTGASRADDGYLHITSQRCIDTRSHKLPSRAVRSAARNKQPTMSGFRGTASLDQMSIFFAISIAVSTSMLSCQAEAFVDNLPNLFGQLKAYQFIPRSSVHLCAIKTKNPERAAKVDCRTLRAPFAFACRRRRPE